MLSQWPICGANSRLGMGCWAIGAHGWGAVDDDDSIAAIRFAHDNGVRLFDTADCYGLGHSENILTRALGGNIGDVVVSTKGGVRWDSSGKVWKDNSPKYLRQALQESLKRLKLDCIPIYFVHWPDGKTPIDEVVRELEKMKQEGLIGAVGLSNFQVPEFERASATGVIDLLQVKFNLLTRRDFLLLEQAGALNGVKVMAYGCLGEGMLTGKYSSATVFPPDDHRVGNAAFQGEAFAKNLEFVQALSDLARSLKLPVANLALRAVMDQKGVQCALFGARNVKQVQQNIECNKIQLQAHQEAIDELVSRFDLPSLSWQF